ncbi:MAG: hypothetical protein IKR56_06175 [Lachnospiraceae bacterium]|nr:hypothetical protein [Lachnospiraceae bacterium]
MSLTTGILLLSTPQIALIVTLVVAVIIGVALYFLNKYATKKQAEQDAAIQSTKQTISMLVIDKKRMKMKEAGLPQMVIDNTPRLLRGSKVPVVKAKIGPQIMTLIADDKIFDLIPVKKEVKATVAGIYIVDVKGIRGSLKNPESEKKKGKFAQMLDNIKEKAGAKPLKK